MGVWNFYHAHNDQSNITIFESTIKTFEPAVKMFELDRECCSEEDYSPAVKHIQPVITKNIERHYYHHYYMYEPVEYKEVRHYHHEVDSEYHGYPDCENEPQFD